ncbi:MAG TPA: hypothetical protein PKH89_08015 [Anaerolineae bacterium]|nr:hypothetical protein [Anaerolineae bacterium]
MRVRIGQLLVMLCMPLLMVGCHPRPLLFNVAVSPSIISPNADGIEDITRISYSMGMAGRVSIYLIDPAGQQHAIRSEAERPVGDYESLFGGVVNNRLLPDGHYTCVVEAESSNGQRARVEAPLTLQGGEPSLIQVQNLNIYPTTFTPNRDGIADRVTIAYYLTKEATSVQVYLVGSDGSKYPVPEDKIRPMGAAGNHEHDYEGGVDLGATPPPDGSYRVVVEARDAVGNVDLAEGTLTIKNGGVPRVEIVNRAAQWSTRVLPLGDTLTFTCTVRNIGNVAVRTKGPPSGTLYTTEENYNAKQAYEEPGTFRLGLDYEGNSSGRTYPFRWQLGTDEALTVIDGQKYLLPGQTVQVVGHLKVIDKPVKVAPYYWLGLIHEQVWIVEDRVEPIPVTIGF